MATKRTIEFEFKTSGTNIEQEMNKVSSSIEKSQTKLKNLGDELSSLGSKMTTRVTLPIVAGFGLMVKSASDLEETMNKIDVIFGESSKDIKKWSKNSIKSFGMAQQTALDMVALYGDMGTGMGLTTELSAEMGKEMVKRVGDLASFKNISQDVAKTALTGIFTGETESLKHLGIVMTEANLEQYALSKGINKNIQDMTQAEKVQLRYAYVMDVSKNSMGDFERTSQSTANQTRSVGEQFKQLSATLGEQLLPIVNKILSKISELITWFGNLDKGTQKTILIILGITAVIGPLLGIIGGLIKFITILTQATWLWSASLWANPITWIVAGIIILIGAITLLILNFDKLDKNTQNVFKSIGNAFIWMLNLMIDGINKMMALILLPFNLLIKGLNLIPGVKIPSLKLEIPKIPKLETGTNIVPRDMMAQLHQGEAVVPKKFNPAMNKSVGLNNSIKLEMPRQEFDIMLDGNRVGKAITPYVTKTVKLGGGNL